MTTHFATADEIARLFDRTPRAVQALAHRHHWHRIHRNGRTHYDLVQAATTLSATRARPPAWHQT